MSRLSVHPVQDRAAAELALHPVLAAQLRQARLDPAALPSEYHALLREVGERYAAADRERSQLRDTVAASRALLEAALACILLVDENGTVTDHNQGFVQMWQLTSSSLVGASLSSLIESMRPLLLDPDGFRESIRQLEPSSTESNGDDVVLTDGRILKRSSVPLLGADGSPRGRLFLFHDVTEQRRLVRDLERANVFLDSIVDNIPDVIFVKEAERLSYLRLNHAGERLLGVKREDLLHKTDLDLFSAEEAAPYRHSDLRTVETGKTQEHPAICAPTTEGPRWFETKKIPILGEDGRCKYVLGISTDVTELRQAQEQLQAANQELELRVEARTRDLRHANEDLVQQIAERKRAEKALEEKDAQLRHVQKMEAIGRLAGGVAHDFNNMLAAVLSYTELLIADAEREQTRADLEEIRKAARRAAELTHQLLAFSRQQVLQTRIVDLNTVVADIEQMLRRLIGENFRLRAVPAPDLGLVEVDLSQFEQVVVNLVLNARDAMPGGGEITIRTENCEHDGRSEVALIVEDDGVGMDCDTRARVFEPFFTTKERGRGTGLGLATVYGIVQQSGGRIDVESEPGKGSRFSIRLQSVEDTLRQRRPSGPPPLFRGSSETVLLVEDEPLVRGVARAILTKHGYVVLEAAGASEALELCEQHGPAIDVLLTDVVMPGLSGPSLAKRLLALYPDMARIYMSGYTADTALDLAACECESAFLQKPFTPATLLRVVREALEDKRAARAVRKQLRSPA